MRKTNFAVMPSVVTTRSKFNRKSQYKTSFNLGYLIPIYLDEVLPGDTRKLDIASLIRMSNPVAPFMDNVDLDVYAFFVPNRLTWTHWKEFMGENNSGAGIYTGTAYTIPKTNLYAAQSGAPVTQGSIGDYFGLPLTTQIATRRLDVSVLPIRGYRLIYNRFFRDQNVAAPLTVNLSDTANVNDYYGVTPKRVAKFSDYFTRAIPYAQKGAPVRIPLGTSAPLVAINSSGVQTVDRFSFDLGVQPESIELVGSKNGVTQFNANLTDPDSVSVSVPGYSSTGNQLFADLSNATASTINQLRFAFQYQKMLEKDAMYGTRYWEIIKGHFGVTAPYGTLQDPEVLGHKKIHIHVDQVVQTTGINQSTPASNTLGQTAAVSVTGDAGNLFTASFCEHGYIHVYVCARHEQTYGQGVERHFSRSLREDFYFPVFANLGCQEIKNKEIYATGFLSQDDGTFGFQEAWAEYRYKPSKVTGLLNPSVNNSLGYWTLANNFSVNPTLGQAFIEQDRNAISRVLSTGNNGPDFIADFAFLDIAVRPMPLYSIPGLIDHH